MKACRGAKAWTSTPLNTWSQFESGHRISCHPPLSIAFDRNPVMQSEQTCGSCLQLGVGSRAGASSSRSSHWQMRQVKTWWSFNSFWYLQNISFYFPLLKKAVVCISGSLLRHNALIIKLSFHNFYRNIKQWLTTFNKTPLLPLGNVMHIILIAYIANATTKLSPVTPSMSSSTTCRVPHEGGIVAARRLCFPATHTVQAPPHLTMEPKVDFPA